LRNHLLPTLSIGPKSDFDTMELGHFRLQNRLDKWNLQVGAGSGGPHGNAESFDHPFLIRSYDEGALPDQKDQQSSEEDISEATRRQEIPQLHLRLLEHVLKRVVFSTPWIFGIPNHAAIVGGLVLERATP
jgi:hypothetical protein